MEKIYLILKESFDHKSKLRGNYHINPHLQNSWNLYGEENFAFELVEECTSKEHLSEREVFWISYYKSQNSEFGYNITAGGGSYGIIKSEETRNKISQSLLGRKIPREIVERNAMKRFKKVYQYTLEGELFDIFDSLKDCADRNGFKSCTITQACKGNLQTAYGFVFSFEPKTDFIITKKRRKGKGITRVVDNKFYDWIEDECIDNSLTRRQIMRRIKKGEFVLNN